MFYPGYLRQHICCVAALMPNTETVITDDIEMSVIVIVCQVHIQIHKSFFAFHTPQIHLFLVTKAPPIIRLTALKASNMIKKSEHSITR